MCGEQANPLDDRAQEVTLGLYYDIFMVQYKDDS